MDAHVPTAGHSGRIFIFGFLSAIAPLSIDIYLPALPMLRQALAADEAQTRCSRFLLSLLDSAEVNCSLGRCRIRSAANPFYLWA
jgi:hypothetical protein